MGITFHLDHFEGPLDLLLHLIAKNKVSIYDIPISEILEQYMKILETAQDLDMDIAGDFISMAAQLVLIKSKMLLPKQENEEEAEDPRAQLVEMLLEYQRIQKVTPYFRQQADYGMDIFVKSPEPKASAQQVEYHSTVQELVRAAKGMVQKVKHRLPPPIEAFTGIVGYEPVSVNSRITMILRRFLQKTQLLFHSLFEGSTSRSEVVATFLAVLELSKTRRIQIAGEGENTSLVLSEEAAAEEQV